MKKLFVCAMALAAFVSCSKDDVQGPALDSANKSVTIAIKNGALATRAAGIGTNVNAGETVPGAGAHGATLESTNASELYVLFADDDRIEMILPLSADETTNDEHNPFPENGEYVVGEKAEVTTKDGDSALAYTWHNVPWTIDNISVVRIDEELDDEYYTVDENGAITLKNDSVKAYKDLAEDEDANLTRELSEIVLFDNQPLRDTNTTHEVEGVTFHYWQADLTVAPKFARFEINNIECTNLGEYNVPGYVQTPGTYKYGFDEMDILDLTWNAKNGKAYTIALAEDATTIGRMYGRYNPTTVKSDDENTYDAETDGRARTADANNAADAVKPAVGNVWSWNVLPTSWTGMTVDLYAYAYDYVLNPEGRTLQLNVIGLDGNNNAAGGEYAFAAGNIYKLNLQFTEENVKDQDQLCVEVTVAIQPWTIVDNLKPVFGN